jgi:hypothetical protein
MKKAAVIVIFLFVCVCIHAQESTVRQNGKVIYMADKEYMDNKIITDVGIGQYLENIIGWSPKGLYAFQTMQGYGEYSIPTLNLVIWSTVEDRKITEVKTKYDRENITEQMKADGLARFNQVLREYNINGRVDTFRDQRDWTAPLQFPHKVNGAVYDSWLEASIENYGDYESAAMKWKLVVGNGTKNKTIASGVNAAEGYGCGASQILGYFESPYENRIIVVVRHFKRVFEGDIEFSIERYGCHLDVGY